MPPFRKVLIANRGEIAVRILRACHEMGIATVAVYSDADRSARHMRLADEAYRVGPAEVERSYLSADRILEAAASSGADAIHPGYGLLAENAAFARQVEAMGITFIGPPAGAIETMGDKAAARMQMQAAGVPVVPGYQGRLIDEIEIHRAADLIGFPLLIKAAAGGGGKGMRVVTAPEMLLELAAAARREAHHAFGDDKLILERYIPHAHHVEMQIFGDRSGKVLHMFERECSVQRRYQKIIEESPSTLLNDALRAAMGSAAVLAARAVGYSNAGTVEFILDPETREFYFLEMNTRLQVEHPVTEMVTGIDLVKWQLRVAAGELLPWEQEDIRSRGHALECRLYAEDPEYSFLPASGKVLRFSEPQGPGIRVDAGITSGDEISVYYDPLIAKIIAYAENRTTAIQKMQTALNETVLLGLTSNIRFLQDVLAHPDFIRARVDTSWVERNFDDWQQPECDIEPEILIAAAFSELFSERQSTDRPAASIDPYSPWQAGDGFRPGSGSLQEGPG